jgi:hypothetical protein
MSEREGLDAQIAQRLFGWTWGRCSPRCWYTQDGFHTADGAHVWRLPAYSTDPTATAQVWQWVEQQAGGLLWIEFQYRDGFVACYPMSARHEATGAGATWPEALCRAALAVAEGLDTGEGEHHA